MEGEEKRGERKRERTHEPIYWYFIDYPGNIKSWQCQFFISMNAVSFQFVKLCILLFCVKCHYKPFAHGWLDSFPDTLEI